MSQAFNIIQSFKCGAAGTIPPNRIIALDPAGLSVQCTGSGGSFASSIGISTEVGSDFGLAMDVVVGGVSYLQVGQVSVAGTLLTSDATGQGIVAVSTNRVAALLLEPCTTIGQVCKVLVVNSVF